MLLEWMKPAKIDADIRGQRPDICWLVFFLMCANLKGVVSEFEMLSDSIRMLNAGKRSEADTEWE